MDLRLNKIRTNIIVHISHATGVIKFENKRKSEHKEYSSKPVDIRDRRLKTRNVNNYLC